MIYTLLGAVIGFFFAGLTGPIIGIDYNSRFDILGPIFIIACTFLGAGIGLGCGSSLLAQGNHPFNHISVSIK